MAETTQFTVEGEVDLAYFTGERDSRHVIIRPDESDDRPVAVGDSSAGERLETRIANALNFPNDAEFDAMFKRLEELREKGLQPADGKPDMIREGVKLRITVEVL